MSGPAVSPLDYQRRRPAVVPTESLVKLGLLCGVVPLVIGVGCFLLFVVLDSDVFSFIGFFTLLGGVGCFGLGAVCLGVYRFQIARAAPEDAAPARRRFRVAATVLVLDLPIAALCASAGRALLERRGSMK